MSYEAIVSKIESIRPIEGADRIIAATVLGVEVVVSSETKINDIGVFFPEDGIFEDSFCENNGLFPVLDKDGKRIGGGFFTKGKARIRSQKFKRVKSCGFWCPISYLTYTKYNLSKLKVGDKFTELNGVKICSKYYTPATLRAQANIAKNGRKQPKTICFPEHVDSLKFQYDMMEIKVGDIVTATVKQHGTSNRIALTYVLEPLTKIQKFINKVYPLFKVKSKLEGLVGTRRVILNEVKTGTSYYGNESFRYKHFDKVKANLESGEVIMGELVGYTTEGGKIMPDHVTKETQDKEFIKKYGEKIEYTYGLPVGECEFYVYRILKVNEDGKSIDLTWPQVKKRCAELGLKHVFEVAPPFIFDGDYESLKQFVKTHENGPDLIDPRIHREGIVLRVDNGNKTPKFIKNKNFYFGLMEGYIKNNDSYVDTEESA
jgi:hypothetical protein